MKVRELRALLDTARDDDEVIVMEEEAYLHPLKTVRQEILTRINLTSKMTSKAYVRYVTRDFVEYFSPGPLSVESGREDVSVVILE